VRVLEARDRIGGRILTLRDVRVPVPLELGAEFVHGEAPHTMELVREAHSIECAVEGDYWRVDGKKLRPVEHVWKRIGDVLSGLKAKRKHDRSLDDYLATKPGGVRRAVDRVLARLASGAVVRVTLLLTERIWEDVPKSRLPRGRRLDRLGFLQPTRGTFNVFWTLYPLRVPVIVAWVGGPPARALAERGPDAVEAEAIAELSRYLGITKRRFSSKVDAAWMHDWVSDPFSRGAYSYATVGGDRAAQTLAQSVDDTLFFAGEATGEDTGTVEGALGSGIKAARRILRVLARE
jgi:hypothetical protein